MPHSSALLGFALVSLGLVLTPGPNMIYLISRSITQGPAAGIVSLGGFEFAVRILESRLDDLSTVGRATTKSVLEFTVRRWMDEDQE